MDKDFFQIAPHYLSDYYCRSKNPNVDVDPTLGRELHHWLVTWITWKVTCSFVLFSPIRRSNVITVQVQVTYLSISTALWGKEDSYCIGAILQKEVVTPFQQNCRQVRSESVMFASLCRSRLPTIMMAQDPQNLRRRLFCHSRKIIERLGKAWTW